jgi:hypothetical protein
VRIVRGPHRVVDADDFSQANDDGVLREEQHNEDIGNDPVNCTPNKVVKNPHQFSSGGCMNCHFSAGADLSYTWLMV